MAYLPDEIIHDGILPRLHDDGDVLALFRCAATCKCWRRLVAGSSFLRRRCPSSLLGFFTGQCHVTWLPGTGPMDACVPLSFVPTGGRSTGLRGNHGSKPYAARFAVYDLLTGSCHVLPELDCGCRFAHHANSYGYAILPSRVGGNYSADGGQPPPTFKVLIFGQDKHNAGYNLHVFAPDNEQHAWRTHVNSFNNPEPKAWTLMHAQGVVCRGHAHWLFSSMSHFHILNVNDETGHVTVTKLLNPTPTKGLNMDGNHIENAVQLYLDSLDDISNMDRLTATANGTLLTLCRYCSEGCRLEMWTRREADGEQQQSAYCYVDWLWLRTRVIELNLSEVNPKLQHPTCVCSGERSGRFLIMDGGSRCMYTVDLETGALEEVTNQFQGHVYNRIMPVELDWPRFLARIAY
ncbi:hypothetical protein ACQ4PT_061036 [Festuca glaucescens]